MRAGVRGLHELSDYVITREANACEMTGKINPVDVEVNGTAS